MLKFGIIGVILLTVTLFALSVHTLFTGLTGAVSEGTFGLNLDKNGPNGDWVLRFNGNPKNPGLMGTSVFIQIGILDLTGQPIAMNSTLVTLSPGEQRSFTLVLTIPYTDVQHYNLTGTQAQAVFEMNFGIRTLFNLVGFTQTMRIAGGVT